MNTVRAVTNLMKQIKWILTSAYNFLSHCERKALKACKTTSHHNLDCVQSRWQKSHQSIVHCIAFNALSTARILINKTVNFLVRKKCKVSIFFSLLQRFKEAFPVQRTIIRIDLLTALSYYISVPLHNAIFLVVSCNVWQGLPSLTSHSLLLWRVYIFQWPVAIYRWQNLLRSCNYIVYLKDVRAQKLPTHRFF